MKVLVSLIFLFIAVANAKEWWENANFYQIYPRSYKDSNGDGVGDLKGITQKLQYIKGIGIDAVWLSPIFKSPMADFGYDIADFYQVHYEYGTMEDFENLLKKANELGLKVILDFVPNHTSDEHEWFQKSVRKEGKYTDYYIWHDGIKKDDPNARPDPPNNWVSVFRYSAWKWNDVRKQYYLHQFIDKQPDLNYRSADVVAEMKQILRFWLNKGVSGFRIDAVPFMFEVAAFPNGTYRDEPLNPNCPNKDDNCYTYHVYTQDQPETYDMIYQWRAILDEYKTNNDNARVILTEAYTSLENIIKYYGDGTVNGSHVPFNFELLSNVNRKSKASDIANIIARYLPLIPKNQYANWVLGNHDQKRLASRLGTNKSDLHNILIQTLPGIAVTYNGEEIAMTDVYIPWNQTVDPQACNTNETVFDEYSRDPARTPFQWDASKNAGFSTADKTWLPVSPDYKKNNVLIQQNAPRSHLHIFKKLVRLRNEPSFDRGTFENKVIGENIMAYKRQLVGSDTYVVVLNFGTTREVINLKKHFPSLGSKLEVITTSLQSNYMDGDIVDATSVVAYEEVGTVFVSL